MNTIKDILTNYPKEIDSLDIELLIANAIGKSREFVLAHPEYKLTQSQISNLIRRGGKISRRRRGEPLAYILGRKEFYGLDFNVDKNTLIPRPETELLVEKVLQNLHTNHQPPTTHIIDVGTGSGNIIIAVTHGAPHAKKGKMNYFGIDTSEKALKIAKKNAKKHGLEKKIKFLKGNLLESIIRNKKFITLPTGRQIHNPQLIILANLPYLSKEIYAGTASNVKKYEPKSALYSAGGGLAHYEKLIGQIKKLRLDGDLPRVVCLFEFSPEQKNRISKLLKYCFPKAPTKFHKDLAGKWRVAEFEV